MRCLLIMLSAIALDLSGATLPRWTPGTLDIHQISTGRGNATLIIMPDGTSLLVDAGAAGSGIPETDPHPDATRTPGEWIARYIRRHLPAGTKGLDYALLTHFHMDHMGGIADVDKALPIGTLLDRGWPDYVYPAAFKDEAMAAYRRFLEARRQQGMKIERFRPGSASQLRMLTAPTRFADFEIRNIIGNGDLWTGNGDTTRHIFPPPEPPNENMCSNGFRLRYGHFRYFTGGDLPGTADPGFPAWQSIEEALAPIIGPVDVHVVNQHGSMGEESEAMLRFLKSTVLIVPSWAPSHPAPDVLKRIMNSRLPPAERYVFVTDMREAAKIVIGQRATQLSAPPGHVVLRVAPGGETYQIYVLTNQNESDEIIAQKGPIKSAN